MNRGEVYWVAFAGPDRRRPAVVLTRQAGLKFLTSVTVAPVTTTTRTTRTWIPVGPQDGIRKVSAVNLDNIQTITIQRFGPLVTRLSEAKMAAVDAAARFALGLGD